ncbi:MAG: dTDP-4-dehydrorhamnose reductase [Fibrobacterales bacterium]
MKTILVTGSNGQLGSEIQVIASNYDVKLILTDVSQLDITVSDNIESFLQNHPNIDVCINCAAYTAVDKAEDDRERADQINHIGPKNLAKASKQYGFKLIQVSTDFVFDGIQSHPYKESDEVNPISVYGKTKCDGEQAVLLENHESIIIRTSWLYSTFGNNFVKTMMKLGTERDTLGIVYDQVGSPTYARDLAQCILGLVDNTEKIEKTNGVFHYSNEGVASWYDFTCAIHDYAEIECVVSPIETKSYPLPAPRPNYSVMDKSKLKTEFGVIIPHWRESLKECITLLSK